MCREAVIMWHRCKVKVKVLWTLAFWGGAFIYISVAFEQIWAYSTLEMISNFFHCHYSEMVLLETWNIFIYRICRCLSPLPPLTHCCPSICNFDFLMRPRKYYCIHCKYFRMPTNRSLQKTRYHAARRRRKSFAKNHSVSIQHKRGTRLWKSDHLGFLDNYYPARARALSI